MVQRSQVVLLVVASIAVSVVVVSRPDHPLSAASKPGARKRVLQEYGSLPISFEPNVGQAPRGYDYVARGQDFGMAIRATGATLALGTKEAQDLLRLNLVGASLSADPRALEPLPGKVNYLIGNEPSEWRSDVPTFGRVSYGEVLPGIDVTYYGTNAGTLEYDFVVAPDADPGDIRIGFPGANDVALEGGSLVVTTESGAVTQAPPMLYQSIAGRRVMVEGRFSLEGGEVGFEVGAYDHRRPLVIDPTIVYSTYLGGSGDDVGWGIAVDGSGAAYVTGSTTSTNFPILAPPAPTPFQGSNAAGYDAFVTKLNAAGSAVYSTYLGGTADDIGEAIAVDGTGAAYVTGQTSSGDFPKFPASAPLPFQSTYMGSFDSFVTKLNATGSALIYSTYLGGSGGDSGNGIAVDTTGAAYVAGYTTSTDFPTQVPFQGSNAGSTDAFLTKLNATGSALAYSSYLGGTGDDSGNGIAIDGSGAAYVAGDTNSTGFPMQAPFQGSLAGSSDAFATKVNATGSALTYSTYLGGSGADIGESIDVDGSGAAYVTGGTGSTNFPTSAPLPFQTANAGADDAFVTKLGATGSTLAYSTYLGGSGGDSGTGISVDGSGRAYVTGFTGSSNFPMQTPIPGQGTYAGSDDGFVTSLNTTGSGPLLYSTYIHGSSSDYSLGIAVDGSGAAYVTGYTYSFDFPTQVPFQGSNAGGSTDAFVTKLGPAAPPATCADQPVTIQVASPGLTTMGTNGVDVIRGTSGLDKIYGLGGNDIICGLSGVDLLYGGASADTLFGDAGKDALTGGASKDVLYGGADNDELLGGIHLDKLYGGANRDTLLGDAGPDTLAGGPGDDNLVGGPGDDSLLGNPGVDYLNGGPDTDTCDGGPGSDVGPGCESNTSLP